MVNIRSLDELLNKAREEKEDKFHVLVDFSSSRLYSGGPFYSSDFYVNLRYWHGKEIRNQMLFRTGSEIPGCDICETIKRIIERIERQGFKVLTARKRTPSNRKFSYKSYLH